MRLENRVTVVESMILMFLNHRGVFLERLSDKMCTFAHSYLFFCKYKSNTKRLDSKRGIQP